MQQHTTTSYLFGYQCTPDEVKEAVNDALEAGYRHIDTAYLYQNEAAIGEVIQEWINSGKLKREELFITTKVSRRMFSQMNESALK